MIILSPKYGLVHGFAIGFSAKVPIFYPLYQEHIVIASKKNRKNMEKLTKVQITAGKGDEITEKVLEQSIEYDIVFMKSKTC